MKESIFIIAKKDLLYLPPFTTNKKAIVVEMVAGIVRLTMKRCPNPDEPNYYKKIMKKNKAIASTSKKPRLKNVPAGTKEYNFFEDVFDVVRKVPKGRVTSYGAIAAYLGTRLSARMVGWAMNASHYAKPKVPAQRVVNRNGMLTGKNHFASATLMEELLLKEKIEVKNDTVVNFKELFWDPVQELHL